MDGASIRVDNLLSEVDEVVLLNDSVIEVKTQLKTAILDRLDQVVSLVFDGTPVNPSHLFWDTLIEACDCPLLKRELVIVNPCRVPTHYRLGLLLADLPNAKRSMLDLRRRYAGALIPVFWNGICSEKSVHTQETTPVVEPKSLLQTTMVDREQRHDLEPLNEFALWPNLDLAHPATVQGRVDVLLVNARHGV